MVGATLELVFMGAIQIGAAVPPDVLVGAGLGTAFAIQSGQGADIALALSLIHICVRLCNLQSGRSI